MEVQRLTDAIKDHFNYVLLDYNFFIQVKRETKDWGSVFTDYDDGTISDKSVIRIIRKAKSVAQARFNIASSALGGAMKMVVCKIVCGCM